MSTSDLIVLEGSESEHEDNGIAVESKKDIGNECPVEEKEESEGVKALKKGAGVVGGFFKKGWGAVKSGASKANDKFKETDFGKKTVAKVEEFKQTEFAQKVSEGAKKTGEVVKEGAIKTGHFVKEGAIKVKEASAPALEKAKENITKVAHDIKASIDSKPAGNGASSKPISTPEEP